MPTNTPNNPNDPLSSVPDGDPRRTTTDGNPRDSRLAERDPANGGARINPLDPNRDHAEPSDVAKRDNVTGRNRDLGLSQPGVDLAGNPISEFAEGDPRRLNGPFVNDPQLLAVSGDLRSGVPLRPNDSVLKVQQSPHRLDIDVTNHQEGWKMHFEKGPYPEFLHPGDGYLIPDNEILDRIAEIISRDVPTTITATPTNPAQFAAGGIGISGDVRFENHTLADPQRVRNRLTRGRFPDGDPRNDGTLGQFAERFQAGDPRIGAARNLRGEAVDPRGVDATNPEMTAFRGDERHDVNVLAGKPLAGDDSSYDGRVESDEARAARLAGDDPGRYRDGSGNPSDPDLNMTQRPGESVESAAARVAAARKRAGVIR